jgi:tetratricopeptide (TPR) repeat protein
MMLASLSSAACRSNPADVITPELVERNNAAVGLMGQFDFNAAVDAFGAVQASAPNWAGAQLNVAIALMNRQRSGDAARAETLLRELLTRPEVALRARYSLGLLLLHDGREAEALPLLTAAANANPADAFAAYFVGQIRMADSPAEAVEWHRRAAAAQPLLRSAYYGAFIGLRRLNREDEAAAMLARFQALERHPQAMTAEFKYTRMGPLSEAITVDDPIDRAPAAPAGTRFESPVPLVADSRAAWRRGGGPRSITVADFTGDEALDLFIASAMDGSAPNAVIVNRDGRYVLDTAHPLARVANVRAALWADLDDDGLVDVVLCRPAGGTQIWKQSSRGQWIDATAIAAVRLTRSDVVDGVVFDADHDGDLDIWLVNASGPNELLNNDGGGFRAIAGVAGLAGDGRPSRGVAVADLDNDRDADVIVLKEAPPHDVFINGRVWEYRRDDTASALIAAPFAALIAADLDTDGEPEIYTAGQRGIERWRRDAARTWRPEALAGSESADAARLAIADTNGDGTLELVATVGVHWKVVDVVASASNRMVAAVAAGGTDAPGGWAVAHLDAANGPSIVGVHESGMPMTWNPGAGRYRYLAVQLSGRDPASDQRRSNVSGLGARITVRTASRWTAVDTTRPDSGPGQSLQPTSIGLGGAQRADFVAITWSDGVFQTELSLDAGRLHRIAETQRQLSSCPVLFAWDGRRFRFVTDVLGVGGIGFFERPGVYSAPYPRENVLLPDGVVPSDDAYRLKIAEPMEEVTYLDRASLVAYDLPPGWHMTLDERKAIASPPPTGAPIFYREERLATHAENDAGENVTATLAFADHVAAGPQHVDSRFIGLARRYSITLTFDRPLNRGPGKPVLLVHGWVEYPYAQTVFAAWQAGAVYEAPTLEARDTAGRWHPVAREFGYPAGMPRQMALPLPPLPADTVALRIRTSQEIYWDRMSIVFAEPPPDARRHVLPLRAARLEPAGFARRTTGPQRTPYYDDLASAPLADTRHPRGWYTEFGRIDPLVADEDAAVAIFGPGEAVVLDFDAPASVLPERWTRHFVFEARGWCKDMDLYTLDGETIEPLPGPNTAARAQLHPRFNTRYAGGF